MHLETITLKTPREYVKFIEKVPSCDCRAVRTYFSLDGSYVLEYDNEYDRSYDYMIYTQPIVYEVLDN